MKNKITIFYLINYILGSLPLAISKIPLFRIASKEYKSGFVIDLYFLSKDSLAFSKDLVNKSSCFKIFDLEKLSMLK